MLTAGNRVGVDPRAITFDAVGDAIVADEFPSPTEDIPLLGAAFLACYTPHGRAAYSAQGGAVIGDEPRRGKRGRRPTRRAHRDRGLEP
jgi:hypothetical protein